MMSGHRVEAKVVGIEGHKPKTSICTQNDISNFNNDLSVSFSLPGLTTYQNIPVTHMHLSTNQITDGSSIALLRLQRTVIISPSVQPICLWEESQNYTAQLDLQIGMMIGTDLTNIGATNNLRILQSPVRVIGETQCRSSYDEILDNRMCFTYIKETQNCHYIGSMMMFPRLADNGDQVWYLRGIISQRIWGCSNGKYSPSLDLAGMYKWISSHFKASVESSCGRRVVSFAPLVTLGQQVERGDFPWHIALYLYSMNKLSISYHCGGTLMSNSIVITAAHCVTAHNAPMAPNRFAIALGKFDLYSKEPGAIIIKVSQVIVHENYGYTSLQNDIALLLLETKVNYNEYIQPVCMWEEANTNKQSVFNVVGKVPGWGKNEREELSQYLYAASVPIVDDLICFQSHEAFYSKYLTNKTICAGYPRGNGTNVCNGDSGGGLVIPITQSDQKVSWYLRGIVSVAIAKANEKSCDPNYYAIYTDVPQYIKWISNNVKKLSEAC
ncbi:CLIP domain-containing serine protease B4-like [Arctopsyche grandis]|uniref:CLIP domain-containing serine protease B4-like n=1 Tax=Arctopsyche grandis TaxID=121162 RepID=UPI00406D9635